MFTQQAYAAQLAAASQQQQAKEQSAQIQQMLMRALRPQAPQIVVAPPAAVVTTGRMGVRPFRGRSMPPVGGVAAAYTSGPAAPGDTAAGLPNPIAVTASGAMIEYSLEAPKGFASIPSRLPPLPTDINNNGNRSSQYFGTYRKEPEQKISDTTIITINRSLDVYAEKDKVKA